MWVRAGDWEMQPQAEECHNLWQHRVTGKETSLSRAFRGSTTLPTPARCTPGLWRCEGIHFCGLKHAVVVICTAAPGNEYSGEHKGAFESSGKRIITMKCAASSSKSS